MNFKLFDSKEFQQKFSKENKNSTKNRLMLKLFLVVFSTAVIVYFMPRSNGFNFQYELNTPWRYGSLYASRKFNILKSDSAIIKSKDSICHAFQPYFNKDNTTLARVKTKLYNITVKSTSGDEEVNILAKNDPKLRPYIEHIASLLDSVYAQGVVTSVSYDSLISKGAESVRVISEFTATPRSCDELYSIHSAYKYIVNQDPENYKANIISRLNLNTILEADLQYDKDKSEEELNDMLSMVGKYIGTVKANESIVNRGELITPLIYQKIKSYETLMHGQDINKEKLPYILGGQALIVLIIMTVLITYLSIFRKDYIEVPRNAILLYVSIMVFCIVTSLMVAHHFFHVFIIPCCIVPITIRVFMDSRTAFMFHTAMVIIMSLSLSNPFEFITLQLIAGMIAIQNMRELTQRSQIFRTAAIVAAAYITFYVAYELTIGTEITEISRSEITYLIINGAMLLFAYPLLWAIEKTFGFISDVTLVELSNINHPLLRRMSEVAPGTLQHSMQVANLATEVAKKIDAKSQLVRTGALYHDIGKIEQPAFFTENQTNRNPHNLISPINSAKVIMRHVALGIALADKYDLPTAIKRFITTHHGTGKTKYFYVTYKNEHPDEDVDESLFTYPGPNPGTAEEAILMMADSVEAASRSLKEYTEESISQLVDKIIDGQIAEGFFKECPITFKDIAIAKDVFKEKLKTIYHTRITYPEYNAAVKEREEEKRKAEEARQQEDNGKESV